MLIGTKVTALLDKTPFNAAKYELVLYSIFKLSSFFSSQFKAKHNDFFKQVLSEGNIIGKSNS